MSQPNSHIKQNKIDISTNQTIVWKKKKHTERFKKEEKWGYLGVEWEEEDLEGGGKGANLLPRSAFLSSSDKPSIVWPLLYVSYVWLYVYVGVSFEFNIIYTSSSFTDISQITVIRVLQKWEKVLHYLQSCKIVR